MLFRTRLSIICVESFFQNHNIFMIMVISGGHYESDAGFFDKNRNESPRGSETRGLS